MSPRAIEALAHWGMSDAILFDAIERENQVHRVDFQDASFALRLHRPGYRTAAQLKSELDWIAMLAAAGLKVPAPEPAVSGELIVDIDGQYISMLEWVPGVRMGQTGMPLELVDRAATFRKLGAGMAQMHRACDAWRPSGSFTRPTWDADGLIGDAPLWGRFWDAPFLDVADRRLLTEFRDAAASELHGLPNADTGLIHADLLGENVLTHGTTQYFIDFDDGGWGYRLFDIATSLIKNRNEPDYTDLEAALLDGYRRFRALDVSDLALFKALRACTYIGWLADRWALPEAESRAVRNTDAARAFITQYLDQK